MTRAPFSLNKEHFELGSEEDTKFVIYFEPASILDCVNMAFTGKLYVCYNKHLYRTALELRGIIERTNLQVEYSKIDFDCLHCDDTKQVFVTITNESNLNVNEDRSFVYTCGEEDQEP